MVADGSSILLINCKCYGNCSETTRRKMARTKWSSEVDDCMSLFDLCIRAMWCEFGMMCHETISFSFFALVEWSLLLLPWLSCGIVSTIIRRNRCFSMHCTSSVHEKIILVGSEYRHFSGKQDGKYHAYPLACEPCVFLFHYLLDWMDDLRNSL